MVPRTNKILEDLDGLAEETAAEFERYKTVADDPARPPEVRREAVRVARDALQRARAYAGLAEQLRAGVIDRRDPVFREMYR